MRVVVTSENQMLLLTVMSVICHCYRATELDFKVGAIEYRKVLSTTMVDLQEKKMKSRQYHDPSVPWFHRPCIYHMKLASVLKL